MKPEPQSALRWVGSHRTGMILMPQRTPRNLIDHSSAEQLKKSNVLVGNPKATGRVLRDGGHGPSGDAAYGNKAGVLQIAEPAHGGGPDSPAVILKKRVRDKSVRLRFAFVVADVWLCLAPAVSRNLPVNPSVQAVACGEPNASVPVRQNGDGLVTQQTLSCGKRRHGKVAKAVEAVGRSHPDVALAILKEVVDVSAREPLGRSKHIRPSTVYVHKAMSVSSAPQTAVAVAEQLFGPELSHAACERIRLDLSVNESLDSAVPADQ